MQQVSQHTDKRKRKIEEVQLETSSSTERKWLHVPMNEKTLQKVSLRTINESYCYFYLNADQIVSFPRL